jgi:hypothetical protein
MLSGALQGAISTNLDGRLGRTGWQWAFLINVGVDHIVLTDSIGNCYYCSRPDGIPGAAGLCKPPLELI